ncbi:MAG: hypothetical protein HYY46_04480 [Deltaproteobacteria bacterium]|nr:hypothetical protein [Deltaproteobacteria bacterium]
MSSVKKKKGRPPKFQEPRRPVTVTLPESTLARLTAIDPDRAKAIAKATDAAMPLDAKRHKQVELVEVMPGLGIILVGPSRYLQKIKWLRLVEVAPTRFLLTIPSGTAVDSLEVAIMDLLENLEPHDKWERSILERLRDLMRTLRLGGKLSKAEFLCIDTKHLGLLAPSHL